MKRRGALLPVQDDIGDAAPGARRKSPVLELRVGYARFNPFWEADSRSAHSTESYWQRMSAQVH